jgi:hypothetical protein
MKKYLYYVAVVLLAASSPAKSSFIDSDNSEKLNDPIYLKCCLEAIKDEVIKNQQEEIKHQLENLKSEIKEIQLQKEGYGGTLGNSFYQTYVSEVVDPVLSHFLGGIQGYINDDNAETILDTLFTWTGKERRYIAITTKTKSVNEFGTRYKKLSDDSMQMMDILRSNTFPKWFAVLQEVLQEQGEDILSKEHERQDKNLQWYSSSLPYLELALPYIGKCKITPHMRDRFSLSSLEPGTSSYYELFYKENQNEGIELTGGIFGHLPARNSKVDSISPSFLRTFYAETQDDIKSSLAEFIWKLSHSSTFMRGQAAITGWFAQALARVRGYNLSYSPDWLDIMNLDQHALTALEMDEFIRSFNENAALEE